jgi:hypothetical protein
LHYWIIKTSDPEKHKEINEQLLGSLKTLEGYNEPKEWTPSWWHGDEDASYSSMMAARSLTKKRKR